MPDYETIIQKPINRKLQYNPIPYRRNTAD